MNTITAKNKIESLRKKREKPIEENVDELEENMNEAIKTKGDKTELIERLQRKIDRMQDRRVITEMKQEDYKVLFDYFNILILIMSAVLTVIEAIKNDVDVERAEEPTKQFFKLTPLIIATGIGLITAIIKFKKFQETMENNTKAIEKSIFTTFRMKKLQEDLHFADEVIFKKIREIYKEEIFPLYNQAQEELESNLHHKDIIKYSGIKKQLENEGNKKLLKLQVIEDQFNQRYQDFYNSQNINNSNNQNSNSNNNFRMVNTHDSMITTNTENSDNLSEVIVTGKNSIIV
jgi:hypothetical protein